MQRSIPGWAGARRALMAGAHGGCGATGQSCTALSPGCVEETLSNPRAGRGAELVLRMWRRNKVLGSKEKKSVSVPQRAASAYRWRTRRVELISLSLRLSTQFRLKSGYEDCVECANPNINPMINPSPTPLGIKDKSARSCQLGARPPAPWRLRTRPPAVTSQHADDK